MLPLLPAYLLVILPNLLSWTVILAYAGPWTLLMIGISVGVKYAVARATRNATHEKLNAERELYREQEWSSVLISLNSPCVVICNDLKVLFWSGLTTASLLAVWLLSLLLIATVDPKEPGDDPPVTHCAPGNETLHGTLCEWSKTDGLVDCGGNNPVICDAAHCSSLVRICDLGESPLRLLGTAIIPVLVALLAASAAISYFLNWAADYKNYYWLSKRFFFWSSGPVVHWNLLFDLAEDVSDGGRELMEEIRREGTREGGGGGKDMCPDRINIHGKTPLHMASTAGNSSMISTLVNIGCSLTPEDRNGWTPLRCAVAENRAEAVGLLLRAGGTNVDADGRNVLHWACEAGHLTVVTELMADDNVSTLINVTDVRGISPLVEACSRGHVEVVKLILEHPDLRLNLYKIAKECPAQWHDIRVKKDVLKPLLEKVDLQSRDNAGRTQFWWAAKKVRCVLT